MAGSYADPPSNRMAYDADGTAVYVVDTVGGTATPVDSADVAALNQVSTDVLSSADRALGVAFVFPEIRNVQAAAVWTDGGGTFRVRVAQTVDPETASWTTLKTAVCTPGASAAVAYRTGLQGVADGSCRMLLLDQIGATAGGSGIGMIHLFGTSEAADRLELWDPLLDQRLAPAALDWGTVVRGSSADKRFRVKNRSTSLTANSITVSIGDIGSAATPPVAAQHVFSVDDGETFSATASISSLAPTQVSEVVTIRRVVPATATFGVWTFRVQASATTWS